MKTAALWLSFVAATPVFAAPLSSVFGPGEQTTYEVTYLGLAAGTAQLTVGAEMEQFGHQVWPLICVGRSSGLTNLYPVKDRFISYWDPALRRTVGSDFYVDENKKRRTERYTYDFAKKEAQVSRHIEGREPTERTFEVDDGTLDLAAAGFGLRNTKLVAGEVHEMPIFTGTKFYRMKATVVGLEHLETRLGSIDVYRVTVNGDFNGKLATKGLMTLFFTADEKQLPVRAEAELLLGTVRLEAVKYEAGHSMGNQ